MVFEPAPRKGKGKGGAKVRRRGDSDGGSDICACPAPFLVSRRGLELLRGQRDACTQCAGPGWAAGDLRWCFLEPECLTIPARRLSPKPRTHGHRCGCFVLVCACAAQARRDPNQAQTTYQVRLEFRATTVARNQRHHTSGWLGLRR